ncbi:hypothetical protein pb186bvf_014066 [Paramecium bursaria]
MTFQYIKQVPKKFQQIYVFEKSREKNYTFYRKKLNAPNIMNKLFEYVTNLKVSNQDQRFDGIKEVVNLAHEKKQAEAAEETKTNNSGLVHEESKICEEQEINDKYLCDNQICEEKLITEEKFISEEKIIGEEKFISEEKEISEEKLICEEKFISEEKEISEEKLICEEKFISEEKEISNDIKPKIEEQEMELLCVYQKPMSSCNQNFDDEIYIKLPQSGHLLDFGIELGFMIHKIGKDIPIKTAYEFVSGYFLAFSFQDRKLKFRFDQKQLPWTLALGQDNFTPMSQIIEERLIRDPYQIQINVQLNDNLIWQGSPKNMIHKIDKLINQISHYQTLYPGDLVLTGSPKLFGPIKKKDRLFASLVSEGELLATIDYKNLILIVLIYLKTQDFRTLLLVYLIGNWNV